MAETLFEASCSNGIITTSESKYQFDPKGVGYMIFTYLQKYSDKPLQIDADTGEKQTYGETLERSIRIALKLQDLGVKPKDTVLICSINHINSCIPVFASFFIGANVTGLDSKMNSVEAAVLMGQINPRIIFVDSKALDFVESLLQSSKRSAMVIVFGPTSNHINFFDLLAPHSDERHFTPVAVEETDIACINFTTGSTGVPKGASISHRAFLTRITAYTECNDLSQRSLLCAGWYWAANYSYWGSIIHQGGCRILREFLVEGETLWKAIAVYKPTNMLMAPFALRLLYESKPSDASADSFQKITIVGAPFSDQELENYRKMFRNAVVVRAYGLTEAGLLLDFPYSTEKDLQFVDQKPKSMGRVLPGNIYKVVDINTGKTLESFQKGELHVKTASALSGCYNNTSIDVFDDDGWLKTGDIVYYDEDYYFYYEDRMKEFIRYRHWHVPVRMIENALLSRDDVTAACVFGIPHEVDEEHPVAVIELKDLSRSKDIEEDICLYIEKLFGDNWKLRGIKILDKIPTTPNGKYDKRKIKDQFLSGI